MEYRHYVSSLIGAATVVIACLAKYGVSAPVVIFCALWALVCCAWFVTTLPGMNAAMRGVAWGVFVVALLLFGQQIPYMLASPRVGPEFCSFISVMIAFLCAVVFVAHLPELEKCKI